MSFVREEKTGKQKTALVLSAGGMFGAYQAGAFQVIEESLKIDMVVGASVGALNGWSIAAGCTSDQLVERWLTPETGNSLRLLPNAGWRTGWFDPKPLQTLAIDLYTRFTPKIPYGLVVVQVPWLKTHLIRYPEVRPEHLRATCSIPYFLPTVEIERRHYLDGAVFEKLPIRAALEMGATRLIAIDSMPEVGPSWLKMGCDVMRKFSRDTRIPPGVDLTVITTDEYMGNANDAVFWKESNIRRWIEMGRRDAEKILGSLRLPESGVSAQPSLTM